jgi:hypothetical protein
MSSTNDTRPNEPHRTDDRTALLLVDDGVVIYDARNPSGWIQSDTSVALSERR